MLEWLNHPVNLPWLIALCVSIGMCLIQILFGFMPDGIDGDADLDADIDADIDADLDTEIDVDHEFDWTASVFDFTGIGKAPLSVLFVLWTFFFGAFGLGSSYACRVFVEIPVTAIIVAGPLYVGSFLAATFVTGRLAKLINRLLPKDKTLTRSGSTYTGQTAVALTDITPKAGQIRLQNRFCSAISSQGRIPKGSKVLVVSYNRQRLCFTVEVVV